jgi:hypothetical protein
MLSLGGSMAGAGGAMPDGGMTNMPKSCDGSCTAVGTCEEGTCRVQGNAGSLTPQQQTQLRAGAAGGDPGTFAWLYPYDKTVFPRGLVSPSLQFDGGPIDAAYVHVSFPGFDYQGFFGASDPARIQVPQDVWTALTSSAQGTDDVKVEVTKLRDGVVTGPITRSWTIASGSVRGSIYYDAHHNSTGSVMRLRPGESSSQVLVPDGTCTAVSGDGSTLIATFGDGFHSYDLRAAAMLMAATNDGNPNCGSLSAMGDLAMFFLAPAASALRDAKTGANLPANGWTESATGGAFAPDGTRIAFSKEGSINLMDFSLATNTFSNPRLLGVAGDAVGSVAFMPDSRSVLYVLPTGKLSRANVDTVQASELTNAYGGSDRASAGEGWVTALPVAVGGYFWVAFTSSRWYGNEDRVGFPSRLWISAVNVDATAADSSHPAFYLDGQEADGVNRFASWALDPCKADGSTCSSGDQCCGGYCREVDGAPQCLSTPPTEASCAQEYEKCSKADDCCDSRQACINNFCAVQVK